MPFLTKLDSRATIKGSRDPLGIQPIWTRFGRHVVGNLTTVTTSVTDFTTLLLGYHFAELLSQEEGTSSELETFLKWEQLAAYARGAVNNDWQFRGTERAFERCRERRKAVISAAVDHQIMSDQKVYGLWGLYTSSGRASGLLEGNPARLTPAAREFVDAHCLPVIEKGAGPSARKIRKILESNATTIDFNRPDEDLLGAIGSLLRVNGGKAGRQFYLEHLLWGGVEGAAEGQQRLFAELLMPAMANAEFQWTVAQVRQLAMAAERMGEVGQLLAHRLERIAVCETVMAPSGAVFSYLLSLEGASPTQAAKRLSEHFGGGLRTVSARAFEALRGELADGDESGGERWVQISKAWESGDYKRLVDLLIEQNKSVMQSRGGAQWIELRRDRLQIRYREETARLPDRKTIPALWRHSYFLESLRLIGRQLRGA